MGLSTGAIFRFNADHGGHGVLANPHRSILKFMDTTIITMESAIPNNEQYTITLKINS